jgi:hypothetical protein
MSTSHVNSLNRKPRLSGEGVFFLDWDAVRALFRADVCGIRGGDLRKMPGYEPRKSKFLKIAQQQLRFVCTTESSRAPTDSNARARIFRVHTCGRYPRVLSTSRALTVVTSGSTIALATRGTRA